MTAFLPRYQSRLRCSVPILIEVRVLHPRQALKVKSTLLYEALPGRRDVDTQVLGKKLVTFSDLNHTS